MESRGELEGVAVAARDERGAAAPLLGRDGRGEEVVGLVAGGLADDEAAGANEIRQHVELVDDLVVEFAAALVGREISWTRQFGASSVSQPTTTARGCSAS